MAAVSPSPASRHLSTPASAMILCAGFGTRLRPLTDRLPKPLVPVGDRPALAHLMERLRLAGLRQAFANSHWNSDKLLDFAAAYGAALKVVNEPEIRGSAGGVAGVRHLLSPPVLVCNGDLFLQGDLPLAEMLERVRRDEVCLVTSDSTEEGTLGLAADGSVVRLRGQKFGAESCAADYVGIVALGGEAVERLPERGCLVADFLLPRLSRGERVGSVRLPGAWFDIGSPAGYLAANRAWLDRHHNRGAGVYVHEQAQVGAGVRLTNCIVGEGAQVVGRGELTGCIVWPEARVAAPSSNLVVTPETRVPLGSVW